MGLPPTRTSRSLHPGGPAWEGPEAARVARPPCRKAAAGAASLPSAPGGATHVSVSFDPFSPAWRDDPYPKYRELRDHAPVHWSPEAKVWCVSRYEDVMAVLRSHDVFSSRAMMTQLMLGGEKDAARHAALAAGSPRGCCVKARINPFALPEGAEPDRLGRRAAHAAARDREPRLHAAPDHGLGEARAGDRGRRACEAPLGRLRRGRRTSRSRCPSR